jgi:beta-galactosidase
VTHVYSSVDRSATLALSADYWLVFRVNGAVVLDQSREPRPHGAPRPGEVRLRVSLQAGWNRLEARVASGSAGFGFWCQVSDPGDLRVSPTLTAPEWLPGEVPAPANLRAEPVTSGAQLLYVEMLQKEDDPYGFTPW